MVDGLVVEPVWLHIPAYLNVAMCSTLKGSYVSQELQTLDSNWSVSLEDWRVATKVSLNEVASDPTCLEMCECVRSEFTKSVTDLTQDDDSDTAAVGSKDWLCNPLYTLTSTNREEVLSPSGWLSDKVVEAAQLLILQQFPHISGLQNPILQQTHTFQVHRGEFVQIINVRNNHWCTISFLALVVVKEKLKCMTACTLLFPLALYV